MADQIDQALDAAVQLTQSGNPKAALDTLRRVFEVLGPNDRRYPEALSLRGTAGLLLGHREALEDIKKACALDPDEPAFQISLGQGAAMVGMPIVAENAFTEACKLSRGHPAAVDKLAEFYVSRQEFHKALSVLEPIVQSGQAAPVLIKRFAEALYLTGDTFRSRDALAQKDRIVEPTSEDRLRLARLDMELRSYEDARTGLDALLARDPGNIQGHMSYVRLAGWQGDWDALNTHADWLATNAFDNPEALALLLDHDRIGRHLGGAETRAKTGTGSPELDAVLRFSLALYHHRAKRFDQAFAIAQHANVELARSRGQEMSPEARRRRQLQDLHRLETAVSVYNLGQMGQPDPSRRFIYLIGAPRTGSSLLQSIIAAPEGVTSLGERGSTLHHLNSVTEQNIVPADWAILANQLQAGDLAGLDRQGLSGPLFVDKTPHHLFVAGLLNRVHPHSTFVNVVRDAGDVAVSMFLRAFPEQFPEATCLEALADHLAFRIEVENRWRNEGLPIHKVHYEAFCDAPADHGAGLFKRIGLTWNERFLDPSARPDAVPTFSSRQVRQPIKPVTRHAWEDYYVFAPDAFERLAEVTAAQSKL